MSKDKCLKKQFRNHKTGQRRVDLELKGNKSIADTLYYGKNVDELERKCRRIYIACFNLGEPTHQYALIFVGANENKNHTQSPKL